VSVAQNPTKEPSYEARMKAPQVHQAQPVDARFRKIGSFILPQQQTAPVAPAPVSRLTNQRDLLRRSGF
jgi:hypothetical protein